MRKGFLESPFAAVDKVLLREGDEKEGNKDVFTDDGGGPESDTARPWTVRRGELVT